MFKSVLQYLCRGKGEGAGRGKGDMLTLDEALLMGATLAVANVVTNISVFTKWPSVRVRTVLWDVECPEPGDTVYIMSVYLGPSYTKCEFAQLRAFGMAQVFINGAPVTVSATRITIPC